MSHLRDRNLGAGARVLVVLAAVALVASACGTSTSSTPKKTFVFGTQVDAITLKALLTSDALRRGIPDAPRFCATQGIPKSRFDPAKAAAHPCRRVAVMARKRRRAVPDEAAAAARSRDDVANDTVDKSRDRFTNRHLAGRSRRGQITVLI